MINLSCPDDLSTYDCVPASRSIASDTTTLTRHSTITVDTIPLINNVFKDSLVRHYVQQFHALIPADLADADIDRLRTRLEVRLRSAYRRSFAHGEELVRVTMDEDFEDFVDQIDEFVDGGRNDGGPHDRGLSRALIRMRGGAVTTRMMTATATATQNAAPVPAAPAPRFPGQGVPLGQGPPAPPPPPPVPPVPPLPPGFPPVPPPPPVVDAPAPERARRDRRNQRARERRAQQRQERERERLRQMDGNPDGDPAGNPDGAGGDGPGNNNDGGNDPGNDDPGGGPPDGGPPPPDDDGGGDGGEDPEPEGFFMRRALPGLPPTIQLTQVEREICRVFYLARIQERHFVPLILLGGYDNWKELSRQSQASWLALNARSCRWNTPVSLPIPATNRLTALSLWIHCRIILGDETNVDSLSREEVDNLVESEVCSYESSATVTMPTLQHENKFDEWHRLVEHYFRLKRNPEGVPLYYVIRDDDRRPTTFTSLMDELMWKLPHSNQYATFRRDNADVYEMIGTEDFEDFVDQIDGIHSALGEQRKS